MLIILCQWQYLYFGHLIFGWPKQSTKTKERFCIFSCPIFRWEDPICMMRFIILPYQTSGFESTRQILLQLCASSSITNNWPTHSIHTLSATASTTTATTATARGVECQYVTFHVAFIVFVILVDSVNDLGCPERLLHSLRIKNRPSIVVIVVVNIVVVIAPCSWSPSASSCQNISQSQWKSLDVPPSCRLARYYSSVHMVKYIQYTTVQYGGNRLKFRLQGWNLGHKKTGI